MKRPWEKWLYLTIAAVAAAISFADGDSAGGWVCVAVGVGVFGLIVLLDWSATRPSGGTPPPPLTFEQGEMEVMRRLGAEPVPIPGEAHDALTCPICKQFQDRWEKPL